MILACPNCIARYRVQVEALGATGRRVKCTRCGHIWHAEPPGYTVEVIHAEPESEPAPAAGPPVPERQPDKPAAEPEPEAAATEAEPADAEGDAQPAPAIDRPEMDSEPRKAQLPVPARPAPRPRGPSVWTWIVSLLVLAACVVGYEARHSITKEWPWAMPVYDVLGIAVGDERGAQPGQPE